VFYYIEGSVSILENNLAVLDCGGVGYGISVSTQTLGRLKLGSRARLYIYTLVREDCFDLYGFYTKEEKRSFELLIGVSGVGPKAAQAILSATTPDSLTLAIMSGNEKALMVAPGIGKRIAQRVILELKDKISKEAADFMPAAGSEPTAASAATGKLSDAASALGVLGYSNNEIAAALKGVEADHMEVQDIVRLALKKITAK